MFLVLTVWENVETNLPQSIRKVNLTSDCGMIGMVPVFDTREQAEDYSKERFKILKLQAVPTASSDQEKE